MPTSHICCFLQNSYYSSDEISNKQILHTAQEEAQHSSSSASTLITSYFRDRLKQGERQLRDQNSIFPIENKQIKLALKVQCNTANNGISQPTTLFQKWDVQIFWLESLCELYLSTYHVDRKSK